MAFSPTIDHTLMTPSGFVSRNKTPRLSTADELDRRRARTRSEIATSKLRAKLAAVQIIQGDDSSWLHVIEDRIVARFASVTDAVAAL